MNQILIIFNYFLGGGGITGVTGISLVYHNRLSFRLDGVNNGMTQGYDGRHKGRNDIQ